MQCALTPAKSESKRLQQNPGSSQVHGKCFTNFREVKIVSFCHNFQETHPASHMQVCNFAQLLVHSLGSGNNLIKLGHAHHVKATAQLLIIFLLHPTFGVNLSILLMNLDLSYLFKLVAKLQLNGSSVEITVDFVIKMGRKHPVFNSGCNSYTPLEFKSSTQKPMEFVINS